MKPTEPPCVSMWAPDPLIPIDYTGILVLKWDPKKAPTNLKLSGTLSTTFPDADHSTPVDPRFVTVGMSDRARILVVVHTEEPRGVRIITARRATRPERQFYEEAQ